MDDCRDVANRRCSFIGQTNSVLCDFGKIDSSVRYRLFRSYCSSNYGYELWFLDNSCVQDFCVALRKGLDGFGTCHITVMVVFCVVCLEIYLSSMKSVGDLCGL